MFNQLQVNPPASPSLSDGTQAYQLGGKAGEAIVADLHGKWYTPSYRGKTFIGCTLVAGTVIPVSTATAATFGLYNPAGSGVNLELIDYDMALVSATAVVGLLELAVLTQVGQGGNALPTSVTQLTALANPIGGVGAQVPQGICFSAATVIASTKLINLGIAFGTTTENAGPIVAHVEFDGKIILAPGTLIHVTGNAAQTTAAVQQFKWAEFAV